MMAHVRKQLRDFIEAALTESGAFPGGVEAISAVHPVDVSGGAVARVMTSNEEASRASMGGPKTRDITLSVNIWTTGEAVEDAIDALTVIAETALIGDPNIAALCVDFDHLNTAIDVESSSSGTPTGRAEMIFAAMIVTVAGNPEQAEA